MAVSDHRWRGHAGDHRWLEPVGGIAELSGRATRHNLRWYVFMESCARRCDVTATGSAIATLQVPDGRSAITRGRHDAGRSGDGCPDADPNGSSGSPRGALTTGHIRGGTDHDAAN
jgi:hypothetical protein